MSDEQNLTISGGIDLCNDFSLTGTSPLPAGYTLAVSTGESSALPGPLQQFYTTFKDNVPGEYFAGIGAGVDNISFGPATITIDNTRVSVIHTSDYESAPNQYLKYITLQGYAQLILFDRFYATAVMVGESSPEKLVNITHLVDYLAKSKAERAELEEKKINEVTLHPSFYASAYNDPINQAKSTCGIYILVDDRTQNVS